MPTRKDLNFEDFKILLEAERKIIEQNIEMLAIEADTLVRENEVGDLADAAELQIDEAIDRTVLNQLKEKRLEIDAALRRIESGSYGICEKTGKLIPTDRLVANPMARTIVDV